MIKRLKAGGQRSFALGKFKFILAPLLMCLSAAATFAAEDPCHEEEKSAALASGASAKSIEPVKTPVNSTGDYYAKAFQRDKLIHAYFYTLMTNSLTVVTIGNSVREPSPIELQNTFTLIEKLTKEIGQRIIFDADSKFAETIATAAGSRGIGITAFGKLPEWASKTGLSQVVPVINPYSRLELFSGMVAGNRIITDDSLIGAALVIDGEKVDIVFDPTGTSKSKMVDLTDKWPGSLGPGPKFTEAMTTRRSLMNLQESLTKLESLRPTGKSTLSTMVNWLTSSAKTPEASGSSAEAFPVLNSKFLAGANAFSVTRAKEIEDSFRAGFELLRAAELSGEKIAGTGGAVLFGSGSDMSDQHDLIYGVARKLTELGITVTTGGAGGLMEVANTGAWDAGGASIGIPLSFGYNIKTEKNIPKGKQTLTVDAAGYEVRIPLLLLNRPLVLVARGSAGTRKEVAATLIMMANFNKAAFPRNIVFLDERCYREFLKEINDLPIPEEVKASFKLISKPEEIVPIVESLAQQLSNKKLLFTAPANPNPRNENTKFIPPPKVDSKVKWNKDDDDYLD